MKWALHLASALVNRPNSFELITRRVSQKRVQTTNCCHPKLTGRQKALNQGQGGKLWYQMGAAQVLLFVVKLAYSGPPLILHHTIDLCPMGPVGPALGTFYRHSTALYPGPHPNARKRQRKPRFQVFTFYCPITHHLSQSHMYSRVRGPFA